MAQCTATSKQSGQQCRRYAIPGATVCKKHGAGAPQVKAKAAERVANEAAVKAMRRFGEPIDTTPTEALLDVVRWTAGYVAWLREKVAQVDSDQELVWGTTREKTGGDDYGTTEEAKPNIWVQLLADWSDRLVKVCAEAIRCNIDERRVRLAEQQGALVADVIKAILADLQLTPEQEGRVADVVPRHLRLLSGTG